jgi:LDH2 family malate/lactate/ureidoglycolate dehydrogenase
MVGASVGSAAGIGGAGLGAAVGIIAPAIVKTITQKVTNITGENAAKLLSNGKLLAAALRNYESLAARRLFIEKLSAKVGYVAGATTANQFNSRR